MNELLTDTLLAEYGNIVEELGAHATDDEIVAALVEQADWTDRGARVIVRLAREYGTAVLRNALALANAMGIEDGSSGI